MDILNVYSNIWSCVETFALLVIIFLFFKDPLRRWHFFGYRPTAIMGLMDFYEGKVLLAKKQGDPWWAFCQGGIYNSDMNCTVQEILRRELGLDPTRFSLRYTETLGTMKIDDPLLLYRSSLSSICIRSRLQGKGYIGCYIRCNFKNIDKDIRLGEGLEETKVMTLEQARQVISQQSLEKEGKTNKKQQMMEKMLLEMEKIFQRYTAKNTKNTTTEPSNLSVENLG